MMFKGIARLLAASCVALAVTTAFPGCEQQEELIDVETPAGEVELEQDEESGDLDVD